MKKLMMMAALVAAVMGAKADLFYWTVDADSWNTSYNYAKLYQSTSQTETGTEIGAAGTLGDSGEIYAVPATVSAPATGSEYYYYILLGTKTDSTFSALAISQYLAYTDAGDYLASSTTGSGSVSAKTWNGGSFSVPEPTSGLLLLVGAAMLALKRRRA